MSVISPFSVSPSLVFSCTLFLSLSFSSVHYRYYMSRLNIWAFFFIKESIVYSFFDGDFWGFVVDGDVDIHGSGFCILLVVA